MTAIATPPVRPDLTGAGPPSHAGPAPTPPSHAGPSPTPPSQPDPSEGHDRLRSGAVPDRRPQTFQLDATSRPVPTIDLSAIEVPARPTTPTAGGPNPAPATITRRTPGSVAATTVGARPISPDATVPLGGRPAPLPEPTQLCCAVVRSAVEALRGERTVQQLVRWLTPSLYSSLRRRVALSRQPATGERAASPVEVLRARTVRLGTHAAETTVVVRDGDRVRAAAVRMEGRRGVWRVVAMEIG